MNNWQDVPTVFYGIYDPDDIGSERNLQMTRADVRALERATVFLIDASYAKYQPRIIELDAKLADIHARCKMAVDAMPEGVHYCGFVSYLRDKADLLSDERRLLSRLQNREASEFFIKCNAVLLAHGWERLEDDEDSTSSAE